MRVAENAAPTKAAAPLPRVGPRRFWTTREETVLRERFPDGGYRACAPLLPGRSSCAIYAHAHSLGLKAPGGERRSDNYETSDAIDAVIKRTYQGEVRKGMVAQIARTLGRPRWWVTARARRLGVVAPRFKEADWTEEELSIAAGNAHRHPGTIRRMLARAGYQRSETAIVVKLKREGQTRADPDHFTATGLAGLMGIDAKTVMRWIEKGGLKAGRRGTNRSEAQGGDQYWIHRKDLRRFIAENAAAVDLRKVDKFWFIDLLVGSA
jgi:hypothetical protein